MERADLFYRLNNKFIDIEKNELKYVKRTNLATSRDEHLK